MMPRFFRVINVIGGLLIILATWTDTFGQIDGATRADWPHYGGTQQAWRYSALDEINTTNVKNLLPVWIFQTGDTADNLHSTPIVVGGVMYIITPRNWVFALDAATGKLIWQYKYPTPRPARPGGLAFALNRGVAVADGKVLFGTRGAFT
jgi:alcohol dehydrogenase (cytochrome c)